jgi:acetyl esterase/lipase
MHAIHRLQQRRLTLSRRIIAFAVLISAATLLSACSPLRALNTLVPERDVSITRDIKFGSNNRNSLDVVVPKQTSGASSSAKPVVVFFYGGAWEMGDKESYFFMAEALASRGYVVVVPDYRLYPEVVFPTYMTDAAAAMQWTIANISKYGGDTNNVYVMGHSAGAQLAALIAFDNRYLQSVALDRARVRGVVSLAGPMDFLPLTEPNLFKIFPESVRADSQPINFVDGKVAPTLLMHGEGDKRVGLHNSRNLAAKIRANGGRAEETYYPEVSHAGILVAFAKPFRDGKPMLDRVQKFIEETKQTSAAS